MLELYIEGKPKLVIDTNSFDMLHLLENKLNKINLSSVHKVTYILKYVKDNKDLSRLKNRIDMLSNIISTKIELVENDKYVFHVILSGKLGDVLGTGRLLNINNDYNSINLYMDNDISLINSILKGTRFGGDTHASLIVKFLSESTGNINNGYVLDILSNDISKPDLKIFLPHLFYKLYGKKIEEIKTDVEGSDKMTLKSIDSNKLKNIVDEIGTHVRGR